MDRAVLRILGVATSYKSARALREFERERFFFTSGVPSRYPLSERVFLFRIIFTCQV